MSPPSRRRVLRLSAAGIAGVAGCSAIGDRPRTVPRLVDVDVLNYHTEPHTVHVRIGTKDEPTYRRSVQSSAGKPREPTFETLEDVPKRPSGTTVVARRDDRPIEPWNSLDIATIDARCIGLQIRVGAYDTERSDLSILKTTNCRA